MDKTKNKGIDPLEEFINPARLEKAPRGFTDKVMSAIVAEPVPYLRKKKNEISRIVPFAVLLLMAVLAIIASVTGSRSESVLASEAHKLFQNIKFPVFGSESLPGFTLPAVAIYITLGIFILGLLDLALRKLFQRRA